MTTPSRSAPAADASAAEHAARAARQSYGRLIAWLAWQWRDIAAAEDALADAFATALERWPEDGVPASPEAWLIAVAKRNLLQAARRQRRADDPALRAMFPADDAAVDTPPAFPDDRLRLMLVCAHPAIDASVHTALMLQVVLGLNAAQIASAYLVSPDAMTKRLTRAKAKIRDARIRFEEPVASDLVERVQAVLEAIYGAYVLDWSSGVASGAGSGYAIATGSAAQRAAPDATGDLADEAVYLAELVVAQLPQHAEALGLLALLWLCESRKAARLDTAGAFVPLDQQDTQRWDQHLIRHAEARLAQAAALHQPGPFQIEAAIQSAHCERAVTGVTPWPGIVRLYQHLLALAPTVGAQIGHAIAVANAESGARGDASSTASRNASSNAGEGVRAGLKLLEEIDATSVAAHQPWWAALAHLRARDGQRDAAAHAYGRALALTSQPVLQRYLAAELARLRTA